MRHHAVGAIDGNCCQVFFAAYLQAQLMSNGPPFSHGTFSRVLDANELREYGRNRGQHARLGKCSGEGQVECHFCGLSPGKNYSRPRRIGDAWRPSETGKNCQQPMRTNHLPLSHSFPFIPTMANQGSLDCNDTNMEETGGGTQGCANFQEKARLGAILLAFQGRN